MICAAVAAPFILFASHLHPFEGRSFPVTFLQDIVAPIEFLWSKSIGAGATGWRRYISHVNTENENEELRTQLLMLRSKLSAYDELRSEVDRLRRDLQLSQQAEPEVLVTEVINNLHDSPFPLLRVGRGESSGVQVGFPVLTTEGVVGRIIRVGHMFSDVQLLTDADFYMDVLLQRTRVRGVLRGTSQGNCLLQLHRRVEIRIGDVVISSGIVGSFPKGLPIGRVMRISYETDNVSQVVTVEPWVDASRLEEVVILKRPSPEIQSIVDAVGAGWLSTPQRKGG